MSQLNVYCKCETNKLCKLCKTLLILFHHFFLVPFHSFLFSLTSNSITTGEKRTRQGKSIHWEFPFHTISIEDCRNWLWELIFGLRGYFTPLGIWLSGILLEIKSNKKWWRFTHEQAITSHLTWQLEKLLQIFAPDGCSHLVWQL